MKSKIDLQQLKNISIFEDSVFLRNLENGELSIEIPESFINTEKLVNLE